MAAAFGHPAAATAIHGQGWTAPFDRVAIGNQHQAPRDKSFDRCCGWCFTGINSGCLAKLAPRIERFVHAVPHLQRLLIFFTEVFVREHTLEFPLPEAGLLTT
jgi:hypothetical protein